MSALYAILLFVIAQRVVELLIARRNTIALLADGGVEHGATHYRFIVGLHAGWICSLFLFIPANQTVNLTLIVTFFALQLGRIWVLVSLGRHWTTRVITLPGHRLVQRGPYRWMRHPNYAIVALEILILPLAFGAWEIAVIFSLLNTVILYHRIRIENMALAEVEQSQP